MKLPPQRDDRCHVRRLKQNCGSCCRPALGPGAFGQVDEALPEEWRSPREVVGRRWVESLVMAARLWRDLGASEVFPDSLDVDLLCRAAGMVPLTGLLGVAADGWSKSANVLLIEAKHGAGRSSDLVGHVRAMAAELVGSRHWIPMTTSLTLSKWL